MQSNKSAPIGIFDSGMGGLTVTKTITEVLPHENIIYFGDTAHMPWGDKSPATIQAYALRICDFLLEHQCKYIVIACHTASAAALEAIKTHINNRAQILNVIDPVINHITDCHVNKKIGLIGTKQTVRSNTYQRRLACLNKNISLQSLATPLLVPLIEEGFAHKAIAEMVIDEYLSHPNLVDIQAIILGCTHYPIIKHHIQAFYAKHRPVEIIDTAALTAALLKQKLHELQLLNVEQNPKRLFYVSDHSEFFSATANLFFPGGVHLTASNLWDF
jgi:glutamate racemase